MFVTGKKYLIVSLLFCLSIGKVHSQGSEYCLEYDGNALCVDMGFCGNGVRTLELWFKPAQHISSSLTQAQTLIARDYNFNDPLSLNEFSLNFVPQGWGYPPGKLVFRRFAGTDTTAAIVSDSAVWRAGKWYHVAAVIDSLQGMKLYINGVLQSNTHPSGSSTGIMGNTPGDKVRLGAWGSNDTRFFKGETDEVRLWTIARNENEIRNKMCSKLTGNEQGLKLYYRCDEGSGNILNDQASGFNGNIINLNAAAWKFSGAPIGDTSVKVYDPVLSAQLLQLNFLPGDNCTVQDITGVSQGAHIYRVNVLPNTLNGIPNAGIGNHYYGVFLTALDGTYDINIDYSAYAANCGNCLRLFTRNDNAIMNWVNGNLTLVSNNCLLTKNNESYIGDNFREEYIAGFLDSIAGNLDTVKLCSSSGLNLTADAAQTYMWSTGETASSIFVNDSGYYWVDVANFGCIYRDSFYVVNAGASEFFIPNIFTPNGDGTNELVTISEGCETFVNGSIYNRWGQIIFEYKTVNDSWNGKTKKGESVPEGVYFIIVNTKDISDAQKVHQGFIHLLR